MVETSSVIGDPMDSAGVSRSQLTRLGCWLAGLAGVLLLFYGVYGVVGYFGCATCSATILAGTASTAARRTLGCAEKQFLSLRKTALL